MNTEALKNKTFWIGFVVIYVVGFAINFLVHEMVLGDTYAELAHVWRPEAEMQANMWLMMLSSAIYLYLFCYIFTFGYQNRGVVEGLRYGLLMGLFLSVPMALDSYAVYPITGALATIWFISGVVMFAIYGAIFAAIYKPRGPRIPV